jgi:hypothetical protein
VIHRHSLLSKEPSLACVLFTSPGDCYCPPPQAFGRHLLDMSDASVEQSLGVAGHKRQRDEDAAAEERRGKVRINEERVVVAAEDDDDVGPAIPAGFVPHAAHIDNAEEDDDVGPAVPAGIAIAAAPKIHRPRGKLGAWLAAHSFKTSWNRACRAAHGASLPGSFADSGHV